MAKQADITEMRSAVRFPLKLKISVKGASGEHEAETRNISAGGVLFDADTDIAVGRHFNAELDVAADGNVGVRIEQHGTRDALSPPGRPARGGGCNR